MMYTESCRKELRVRLAALCFLLDLKAQAIMYGAVFGRKLGPSATYSVPLTYALYMTGFFKTLKKEVRAQSAESVKQLMSNISQNYSDIICTTRRNDVLS